MTKTIYLKRKYLHEFETIQRHFGESIRDFTNRYHRTERSLLAVGINAQAMYDEESRGSRILDRMRLSLEAQRLVLVGCQQSLKYHDVVESALLQFPQHRPAPLVSMSKSLRGRGTEIIGQINPNHIQPTLDKAEDKATKKVARAIPKANARQTSPTPRGPMLLRTLTMRTNLPKIIQKNRQPMRMPTNKLLMEMRPTRTKKMKAPLRAKMMSSIPASVTLCNA